ncbi:JAB domain-containing protein [uncultured Pedobacter sp.]|uniref:JAB domain-containing protein n=1 Tax=uncultured Pedobacter sp. TaxID=246139 RepID=UPI00262ADA22|nr:JAB domain-containing protein [uncultured Pedobacter sp.]
MEKQIQMPATVAEIQLTYRSKVKPSDCPRVCSSASAYQVFLDSWDKLQINFREQLRVMLLNTRGRVLGIFDMSFGGTRCTLAEPKLIFAAAIKANAASIILAHNHPTGETSPSEADRTLTNKLAAIGNLLEIPLADHLVITEDKYFSFADEGLL